MSWNLSFISEENFTKHVKATIDKYSEKLESFDIVRFNKNIIGSYSAGLRIYCADRMKK